MSDGVWQSVSEVAAGRGVSKQAISKRLKGLAGRVSTRQERGRLLVNVPEFDRITAADTDPAQSLRNRTQPAGAARTAMGGNAGPGMSAVGSLAGGAGDVPQRPQGDLAAKVFSQQRAKRESYEAEMARLELEERQGRLVPVADVEQAMVLCAEVLVREIDQLPGVTDDPVVRAILKDKARSLRDTLARSMRLLAAGDDQTETEGQAA